MISGHPEKVSRSFPGMAGDTRHIRRLRDDITNFLGNMEVVRQFGCKHNYYSVSSGFTNCPGMLKVIMMFERIFFVNLIGFFENRKEHQ